jgi:hypothetical protein
VAVIDGDTNTIIDLIAHPGLGMGIAVNPVTHRVYVNTDYRGPEAAHRIVHNRYIGDFAPLGQLVVIDGVHRNVVGRHESSYCQGIAVDPLSGRVFIADRSGTAIAGDVLVFQDVAPNSP